MITGVPGEAFEDYLETVALMERLKPSSYAFQIFVGIPTSPLYRQMLEEQSYEYIDDLGLVYPPGFDVKTRFFYNHDSTCFVDYKFCKRTEFDKQLLARMNK